MGKRRDAMVDLDELDIFHGKTTHQLAHIYARLPRTSESMKLQGRLAGPESILGATLPAKFDFLDQGPGPTILSRAIITDPCLWTPQSPSLYRLKLDLLDGSRTVGSVERTFGLRQFGVAGKCFRREGKRWVLRGIHWNPAEEIDWERCRESATAILLEDPDDDCLSQASRQGVYLAVYVRGEPRRISRRLRRLARWAAVALAIVDAPPPSDASLPEAPPPDAKLHDAAPNMVLLQMVNCREQRALAPWADAAICEAPSREAFRAKAESLTVPLIAMRRMEPREPFGKRRAACDQLQRDLAPDADYAGFVV